MNLLTSPTLVETADSDEMASAIAALTTTKSHYGPVAGGRKRIVVPAFVVFAYDPAATLASAPKQAAAVLVEEEEGVALNYLDTAASAFTNPAVRARLADQS